MQSSQVYFEISSLVNLTTEMKMLNIKSGDRIEVTQFDASHICFPVDPKSCALSQLVKIDGILHFQEGPTDFSALGKVMKIQKHEKEKLDVTFELRSFDKKIWTRFTTVLSERQSQLDQLFSSMRDNE